MCASPQRFSTNRITLTSSGFALNHFLTYNFGKVKKWYKGSQNTPNALNISKLYVLKGSHKLHIIGHTPLITYWYATHCVYCRVHTKGSRFVVNPCEPFVNPWICAIDCNTWGYVELWTLMQKDLQKKLCGQNQKTYGILHFL